MLIHPWPDVDIEKAQDVVLLSASSSSDPAESQILYGTADSDKQPHLGSEHSRYA